jgi:hypothetical protein
MGANIESQLMECLDALEQGVSLDTVLTTYPDHAEQLRAALLIARAMGQITTYPQTAAQTVSKAKFLERAAALRVQSRFRMPQRPLLPAFGALMVGLSLTLLLMISSAPALPGDSLYAAKRAGEEMQLLFTSSQSARADFREALNQRRIEEITALLEKGGAAYVDFYGSIEQEKYGYYKISGLTVFVNAETGIMDKLQVGQNVTVRGYVGQGRLIAVQIKVDSVSSQPEPTVTPPTPPALTPSATPPLTLTEIVEPTEPADMTEVPDQDIPAITP